MSLPRPSTPALQQDPGFQPAQIEEYSGGANTERAVAHPGYVWRVAEKRAAGFWSYVHADDVAVGGRITGLATAITEAYALVTGEPLDLFLDRDSLEWGDAWKERIDEAIAGTTFFIPIITPRYFASSECRRELVRFTGEARRLGLEDLLLPVYYVEVPEFEQEEPHDELMRLFKARQWEDWRELRLEEPSSSSVLKGVQKMASKLAEIAAHVALVPEKLPASADEAEKEAEQRPGLIDLLAQGEEAMPRMAAEVEALGTQLEEIGMLMQEATKEVEAADARAAGFAARLTIARKLASKLDGPAERIEEHGRDYATALMDSDAAIHALLDGISDAVAQGTASPQDLKDALQFLESMRELKANADEGLASLAQFLEGLEGVSDISRDIVGPRLGSGRAFRAWWTAKRSSRSGRVELRGWRSGSDGVAQPTIQWASHDQT